MSLIDDIRHEILFVDEARLRKMDTCFAASSKMKDQFPDGVEITVELCEKHSADYDFYWAASHFLDGMDHASWKTEYSRWEKINATTSDHLYALRDDDSEILTAEEYTRLRQKNSKMFSQNIARSFGNAMVKKANRTARAVARRLSELNDDELRYKVLYVTLERLKALGTCESGIEKFQEKFGDDGVEITKEMALLHRNDFSWDVASDLLLNKEARLEYRALADAAHNTYIELTERTWAQRDAGELTSWENTGIQQLADFNYAGDRAVAFATAAIHQYETLKAQLAEEAVQEEVPVSEETDPEDTENSNG